MKKKNYTIEFKKQAVELAASLGNTVEAARQLGVADGSIITWRKKFKGPESANQKFPEKNTQDVELARLRKENADLKKVNHILKAAAAFFS